MKKDGRLSYAGAYIVLSAHAVEVGHAACAAGTELGEVYFFFGFRVSWLHKSSLGAFVVGKGV